VSTAEFPSKRGGLDPIFTAGTAQVPAVSQSQLALIQQAQTTLYPDALPFLYSGAYRLMGAALYFQQRYKEAFYTHDRGYLAAIESRGTWNIAESLSWAAYVYQECNQHAKAIEAIQEALMVIENRQDEASLRLKAHLLACWTENATRLHEKRTASEKLESSEALLDQLAPNEEFDRSKWLQQADIYALYLKQNDLAAERLQQALDELPARWLLCYLSTALPLAKAYTRMKERDQALHVVQNTLPVIQSVQSGTFTEEFQSFLQDDLLKSFPGDQRCQRAIIDAQKQLAIA
jgi:tetratricopeptide (TPR) repeat protein